MSIKNKAKISRSETLLCKSDTKVPERGRKSLTSEIQASGGTIPSSSTLALPLFLPILGCFELFKVEFVRSVGVGAGFKFDYFMMIIAIWLGCGVVKRGKRVRCVTVTYLIGFMYGSVNDSILRNVNRKLALLVKSGLLVRERSVSSSGYYLYSVSSVAEKLLLSKVDVKTIRELNALVKSVL